MKKKCDPPVYMSHHEVPLFLEERCAFNVVLAADLAAGVRALSKVAGGFDGPLEPELLAGARALTLGSGGRVAVAVFLTQPPGSPGFASDAIHECVHAADVALSRVGVRIEERAGGEAPAYLTAWMAEKVFRLEKEVLTRRRACAKVRATKAKKGLKGKGK